MIDHSFELTRPKLWASDGSIADHYKVWPANVYYGVFGEECGVVPDDAEAAIEHVLFIRRSRDREIFFARYKDCRSCASIGRDYGITSNRVDQIVKKALRVMRHPTRIKCLRDLSGHSERVKSLEATSREIENHRSAVDTNSTVDTETIFSTLIEELNLTVRSYNCLMRAGVGTLGDVAQKSMTELKGIRNLGRRSLEEIVSVCKRYGVVLGE